MIRMTPLSDSGMPCGWRQAPGVKDTGVPRRQERPTHTHARRALPPPFPSPPASRPRPPSYPDTRLEHALPQRLLHADFDGPAVGCQRVGQLAHQLQQRADAVHVKLGVQLRDGAPAGGGVGRGRARQRAVIRLSAATGPK